MTTSLQFGLNFGVPEVRAAWGARVIVTQDGHVDFVPGRSSDFGSEEDTTALFAALDARFPMGDLRDEIRGRLQRFEIGTREQALHTLFDDGTLVVVGNTNGSAGYIYLRAYLRDHEAAVRPSGEELDAAGRNHPRPSGEELDREARARREGVA